MVTDSSPAAESSLRLTWCWVTVALRVLLFTVLLTHGAVALSYAHPNGASYERLLQDVRTGRIQHLYVGGTNENEASARWSTGLMSWWELRGPRSAYDPPDDRTITLREALQTAANRSGRPLSMKDLPDSSFWMWNAASEFGGLAWIVAFLMMLSRTAHRYANRWAWFLLFTIGAAGAPLYVLLEPSPLWTPPTRPPEPRPPERLIKGWSGFGAAVLLNAAVLIAGIGVNRLGRG